MSEDSRDSPVTPQAPLSDDDSLSSGELDMTTLLASHGEEALPRGRSRRASLDHWQPAGARVSSSDRSRSQSPSTPPKQEVGKPAEVLRSPLLSDTPDVRLKGPVYPLLAEDRNMQDSVRRRELFAAASPAPGNRVTLERLSVTRSTLLSPQRASLDLGTDSESEALAKQRFFQRVEKQWQASHEGDNKPDYALLNQVDVASSNASMDRVLNQLEQKRMAVEGEPRRRSSLAPREVEVAPPRPGSSNPSNTDYEDSYASYNSEDADHTSPVAPEDKAPRPRVTANSDKSTPSNDWRAKSPGSTGGKGQSERPSGSERSDRSSTNSFQGGQQSSEKEATVIHSAVVQATHDEQEPQLPQAESICSPAPSAPGSTKSQTTQRKEEATAVPGTPNAQPGIAKEVTRGASELVKVPAGAESRRAEAAEGAVRGSRGNPSDGESTSGRELKPPTLRLPQKRSPKGHMDEHPAVGVAGSVRRAAALQAAGAAAARLEDLRHQLAEERAARQAAAQRLAEQRKEAEKAERRIREGWEAKLREVQKEKNALSIRLQELEGQNPKQRLLRGGPEVHLTEEELKALRQEIQEQETLIKGYQAENEKLVEATKEAAAEAKERVRLMSEENVRLATALARAEQEHSLKTADTATHLHRILHLEGELEALRSESAARELDLKFELDRARQAKKDIENKYAGLDPAKMAQEDHALAAARQELAREKEAHAKEVAGLEKKVRWYVENQEILDHSQVTIQSQANMIAELQQQLASYEGGSKEGAGKTESNEKGTAGKQAKPVGAATANVRAGARVRQLEKQVKTLEGELAAVRGAPNSLAALVAAAKPSPEESALVAALRTQLETATAALEEKDQQSALALRSLRQEHERIKAGYEARLAAVRNQQARGLKGEGDKVPVAIGRTKELEKQIEELRDFYSKKIKELTKKLEEAGKKSRNNGGTEEGSTKATAAAPPGKLATQRGRQLVQARERIAELEELLAHKEAALQALSQQEPTDRPASSAPPPTEATEQPFAREQALQAEVASLQQHCRDLQSLLQAQREASSRSGLANGKENALPGVPWGERIHRGGQECSVEDVVALRRAVDMAEMARDMAQRQAIDAIERAAVLRLQHHQTVARLQNAHAAKLAALRVNGDQGQLAEAEGRCHELEHQVQQLKDQLRAAQASPHSAQVSNSFTPCQRSAHAVAWMELFRFWEMEARIADMEERQRKREEQWQAILKETKAMLDTEVDEERRKWAEAMEAKNAEIEQFRTELEAIIKTAIALQNNQS